MQLDYRVECPSGCGWHWRELRGADGLAYAEEHCPRCESGYLVVQRGESLVGVVAVESRDVNAVRDALGTLDGVTPAEVALLVERTERAEGRKVV